MYVNHEQLQRALAALDSATLRTRLDSGELSAQARTIASAELQRREAGGAAPAASPPASCAVPSAPAPVDPNAGVPYAVPRAPGFTLPRPLLKAALVVYVLVVLLAVMVVVADPPWVPPRQGMWSGALGTFASIAAGLPWSLLLLFKMGATLGTTLFITLCWLCVPVNLALFAVLFRRSE